MSDNHEELQYVNLIKKIIEEGTWEEGRNGKTKSIFGHTMRFSLQGGKIPILTTKKTAWKTCLKELLWLIRGETDNKLLQEQGVHIWDGNSSKEFMESRGLGHYPEGLLGPIYGYQWRGFNGDYDMNTGRRLISHSSNAGGTCPLPATTSAIAPSAIAPSNQLQSTRHESHRPNFRRNFHY